MLKLNGKRAIASWNLSISNIISWIRNEGTEKENYEDPNFLILTFAVGDSMSYTISRGMLGEIIMVSNRNSYSCFYTEGNRNKCELTGSVLNMFIDRNTENAIDRYIDVRTDLAFRLDKSEIL